MESRVNPDVRLGEAAMPALRLHASKAERINRWLVLAAGVLAVALVALGTWVTVDRSTVDQATPAPPTQIEVADQATYQTIDALLAAKTGQEFASFFTEDGVFDVRTDEFATYRGRESIARANQRGFDLGWSAYRLGSVARWDDLAAHAIAGPSTPSPSGDRDFHGMFIYELTPDGQIRHMWAFGDFRR